MQYFASSDKIGAVPNDFEVSVILILKRIVKSGMKLGMSLVRIGSVIGE